MPLLLDVRTVFFTEAATALVVSISLLLILLSRRTHRGFGDWTGGVFVFNLGLLLIGLRGYLPGIASILFANACILGATMWINRAVINFVGRRWSWAFDAAMFGLWIVPFSYFTFLRPSVAARTELILPFTIVYWVSTFAVAVSSVRRRYGRNLILPLGLAIVVVLDLLRLIDVIAYRYGGRSLMHAGTSASLFLIGTFSSGFFIMIGLVELNTQKTEQELRLAVSEVKTLRGIVPICASCKKVRDDSGYWNAVEAYVQKHTEAEFSHSLCPDCVRKLYPDLHEEALG